MKFRSFLYGLGAFVLVLLGISAGGFIWLTSNSPLALLQGGGRAEPQATIFVAKQAPVMVSLLVNPSELEEFRVAIAPPGQRRQARAELEQLQQNLLSSTGLNYQTDIQPWLGDEVTMAVTTPDLDRDLANGLQPGYLLALATQDPEQSRQFLQLFWQKRAIAGTDLVFEQYAGVKLIYGKPVELPSDLETLPSIAADQATLASAVVGDRFVLFANHPKVLREAINNVQAPGLSLSSSEAYQDAVKRLPDRQIGVTFVNLPQLAIWLAGAPTTSSAASEMLASEYQPHQYESLLAALQLNRQGILADTAILAAAGERLKTTKPTLSKPVEALRFIPANSPVAAAGEDLQQFWQQLGTGLSDYSTLETLVQQPLAALERRWNLDLPDDVFSWVKGEYALGLLPRTDSTPAQTQPEWVFVAERTAAAEGAIAHLDAIARQQGLSIGSFPLGEQPVSAWTKLSPTRTSNRKAADSITLQAEVQGIHATVDHYEIFATSTEALSLALQAQQNSLRDAKPFQQAIAPLASSNNGYLYVDWSAVHDLVEQQVPIIRLAELAAKPFFEQLRSLTVSSYGSENNVRRGAIFFRLTD